MRGQIDPPRGSKWPKRVKMAIMGQIWVKMAKKGSKIGAFLRGYLGVQIDPPPMEKGSKRAKWVFRVEKGQYGPIWVQNTVHFRVLYEGSNRPSQGVHPDPYGLDWAGRVGRPARAHPDPSQTPPRGGLTPHTSPNHPF